MLSVTQRERQTLLDDVGTRELPTCPLLHSAPFFAPRPRRKFRPGPATTPVVPRVKHASIATIADDRCSGHR